MTDSDNGSCSPSGAQIDDLLHEAVDLCDWSSALWCCGHNYSRSRFCSDGRQSEEAKQSNRQDGATSTGDVKRWRGKTQKTSDCDDDDDEDGILTMAEAYNYGEMFKECLELLKDRNEEQVLRNNNNVKDSEPSCCLMVKSWLGLDLHSKAEKFVENILLENASTRYEEREEFRSSHRQATNSGDQPNNSESSRGGIEQASAFSLSCRKIPYKIAEPNTIVLHLQLSSASAVPRRFWPRLLYWYLICIQRCPATVQDSNELDVKSTAAPLLTGSGSFADWNDETRVGEQNNDCFKKFELVTKLIDRNQQQQLGAIKDGQQQHNCMRGGDGDDDDVDKDDDDDDDVLVLSELLLLSGKQRDRRNFSSLSPLFFTSVTCSKSTPLQLYLHHSIASQRSCPHQNFSSLIKAAKWRHAITLSPSSSSSNNALTISSSLASNPYYNIPLIYTSLMLPYPHTLIDTPTTRQQQQDQSASAAQPQHCEDTNCSSSQHSSIPQQLLPPFNAAAHLFQLDPLLSALVYWRKGLGLLHDKSFYAAQKALRSALQLCPFLFHCWLNLSKSYHLSNRNEQAIHACQAALDLAPNNSEARALFNSIVNSTKACGS